ncbi:IPT/TIG domain-containing protein [Streptomyces sp. ISL-99]|uniref:RHS repeat-associated core domain-containing protein n=1 Tax=Streptomyces sp. ISL-99 TaxID=2819193 RepID=UPI001BE77D9A|nr:RHS repeat-associated core domain-containing protein [Streptomyces sp. ISL-99]MBT2525585.1 IPT/TIG domain-containing protein [Streptomyces sp. ISL-99]
MHSNGGQFRLRPFSGRGRALTVGALVMALASGAVSTSATERVSVQRGPVLAPADVTFDKESPLAADLGVDRVAAGEQTTDNALYAYDAAGRLAGVTDPDGETARYRYDAAGNRLGVDRYASTRLSILSLVPIRAAAGATVTLSGTGFATAAESNAVSFGSERAEILSASATRLTVKVPASAGNGKVSVTTGGATAESPESFTLASPRPALTGMAPTTGALDAEVTLSGSGFAPALSDNVVRFGGGVVAHVTGRTDTTLTVRVPPGSDSGPVEIETPDGRAVSTTSFSVVGNGEGKVESSESTDVTDGTPPTVAVLTPGNFAEVSFEAEAGDHLNFGFSASTFNKGVKLKLIGPQGTQVGNSGSFNGAVSDWEMRNLPLAGRYVLRLEPGSDNIGAATVTVSYPVTGTLDLSGPAVEARIDRIGQNAEWTFDAQLGESLSLGLDSAGLSKSLTASLYAPDGSKVGGRNVSASSSGSIDVDALPQSGKYRLSADPYPDAVGIVKATASHYADAGTLEPNGPEATMRVTRAGQNGLARFTAAAGDVVSLGVTTADFPSGTTLEVLGPDGKRVGSSFVVSATERAEWDSAVLPTSGTYTIAASPALTGTGALTLILSRPVVVGQLSTTSAPGRADVIRFGQDVESGFHAKAGDDLSLAITGNAFTSSVDVSVLAPSGALVVSGKRVAAGAEAAVSLSDLPESGLYRVFVDPYQGATGSLHLVLSADVPVALSVTGAAAAVELARKGQQARGSFSAAVGDDLSLAVTGNSFSVALDVTVFAPSGAKVVNGRSVARGKSISIGMPDLPEAGTYVVQVANGNAGTGALTLTLSADVRVSISPDGASIPVTLTRAGQRVRAEFTAGDTGSLGVAVTANTVSRITDVRLIGPSGGEGSSVGSVSATSPGAEYLTGLTSGTKYAVLFAPDSAVTGGLTLWLSKPVAAALSPAVPSVTGELTRPGQQLEFTLSRATGDGASVVFSGTTLTESSQVMHLAPGAGEPTRLASMSTSPTDADLLAPLSGGTHRVLVWPRKPATGKTTATLVPDVDGGTLTPGGAKRPVDLTQAGQNAHYTFSGAKGQKLTLTLDDPPHNWSLYVHGPDGKWLVNGRSMGDSMLTTDLPALTADGTHTLTLEPGTMLTGSYNLGLKITGTAAASAAKAPTPGTGSLPPAATTRLKAVPSGPDSWQPGAPQLRGRGPWTTAGGKVPKAPPALRGPARTTAVTGRVLKLDGQPLAKVTVSVGKKSARTDTQGRFIVSGIGAQSATVIVDGSTANTSKRQYGRFDIHFRAKAGRTVDLGFPVWMTPLDTKHTMKFGAPTKADVVLKTPKIPGLEVRIPKGSVVRDDKGRPVTELGITAIPLDRPPFPLPKKSVVPVYFTVQPGGTYVFPKGAQIIYPNYTREAPGTRVEFMNYDPKKKGWYVYGHGAVTADGRQVVPDADTRVWAFHGAMFNANDLVPWLTSWLQDSLDWLSGDPVQLGTGMLTDSRTDLAVADERGPAEVTRTYWQGDARKRAFGIGRDLSYNAFLHSEREFQEVDLYLPGGSKVHFTRTSAGTGYTNAVFEPLDTPSTFRGSKILYVNGQWELRLRDGHVWVFPQYSPLKEIRDRHGNTVTLQRLAGTRGEVTRIVTSGGRWISLAYDAERRVREARDNTGRTTAYTYDTAGRLETVTDPAGKVSRYTYDGTTNRIRTATDARGITYMTNAFDADGRVEKQTLTEGATYTFEYTKTGTGRITATTVTEPGGAVRRVEFDTEGFGIKDTQAHGSTLARTTLYERGPNLRIDAVTDPYGRRTEITYDGEGRVTRTTELAGTPQARTSGTVTFDGPYGQPTRLTDPLGNATTLRYGADGDLEMVTDPEGRATGFELTAEGLLRSVTDASGAKTEYTYRNGALATVRDPEGRVSGQFTDAAGRPTGLVDEAGAITTLHYDTLNQVRKVIDPLGHELALDYDDNGNLTTLTDARGHSTTWQYDDSDQPTSVKDPLGAEALFEYDPAGRLTKGTSRSGEVSTAGYDLLGRVESAKFGIDAAGQAQSTVTYEYGNTDLLTSIADSAHGTQTFSYDPYDRMRTATGSTGTVTYDYDGADRRKEMTASGITTVYGYDKSSALTSVTTGDQNVVIGLDQVGREKTTALPGGIARATSRDKTGAITKISYARGTATVGDLTYGRDVRGQQTSMSGSLASVALPAAQTDTVFGKDNRVTSFDGRSFSYDKDGQLTNDGLRSYTWDARGQLTGLTSSAEAGQNASFRYDPLGTRNSKTLGDTTDKYLTDGSNPLVEQNGSGSPAATVATSGVDQYLTRTENGVTQIYLTDALGSVVGLADADGSITTRYSYDPYGTPTANGAASSNPYTFTGREADGSGLLHYRNRYYDPETGRFISQDPIGFTGGANLYEYAVSSPTTYTDPSGHLPIIPVAVVAATTLGYMAHQRLTGRKITWRGTMEAATFGVCVVALLTTCAGVSLAVVGLKFAEDEDKLSWEEAKSNGIANLQSTGIALGFGSIGLSSIKHFGTRFGLKPNKAQGRHASAGHGKHARPKGKHAVRTDRVAQGAGYTIGSVFGIQGCGISTALPLWCESDPFGKEEQ